ncbi:transmembrane protein 40 isoform X1 [Crotalus tigris]|uniref:transmembrane protein 40 isoform X1 n=1 Tax=Crotalus tigris TaxID=88082 RepID=UPI00192F12A1|nr:transmembrane protein 40 isoform X1 [Crotalus tigris]XP_039207000.1 transmembrane protein 40 isoform X1 [Crotalus tigris]XP_039207001.1 transmembrane protein 40 isoform X1 [Crotalus tigris]XP_039207002.1 transmembrane protein 40 isoform X1 [Crotalus tigris]XP_039207003.1 transmembrane protein 40 isoform X1 [Crotalus tigris]XP_039207004.1 transmembrane protein 40 isoform X1 [Crotalus tigris]
MQEESEDKSSLGELTESPQQDLSSEIIPYSETDLSSEIIPYSETENTRTEGTPAVVCEEGICQTIQHPRWWIPRIRKDDEFFHFIIICFAVGMLLVCYYKYNDWTVSTGIGLMTFAALETTGIYFGLVHRIRSILESFIPLIQRIRMPGFKKLN